MSFSSWDDDLDTPDYASTLEPLDVNSTPTPGTPSTGTQLAHPQQVLVSWEDMSRKQKAGVRVMRVHRHTKHNLAWWFLFAAAVLVVVGVGITAPTWVTLVVIAAVLVLGAIIKVSADNWD